jgi:hypothetical protein
MSTAPLALHDGDTAFRSRLEQMYLAERFRFHAYVIQYAVDHGYGRQDAVAFDKAVTQRVRSEMTGGPA